MQFICEIEELKMGLLAIKPILSITKRFSEFMLRVVDGEVQFCYHDGVHSFIYRVMAQTEEIGDYVVDYNKFLSLVNSSGRTSGVEVKPIQCHIDEKNTLTLTSTQYIQDKETQEEKIISHMKYTMQVLNPTNIPKYQLFLQVDYMKLFEATTYDTWDTEHLYQTIKTLKSSDKNVLLYFDAQEHKAKARQLNSATSMDTPYLETHNFVIYTLEALALGECCSKLTKEVFIHNENNEALYIISPSQSFAISFQMPVGQLVDKKAFELFELIEIKDLQFTIHKATFLHTLRALRDTTSLDKYQFKIKQSKSGAYLLNILTSQSSGAILSDMNVLIENLTSVDDVNPINYNALFNLETFLNVLSKAKAAYLEVRINVVDNRMYEIIDIDPATTLSTSYYGVLEEN